MQKKNMQKKQKCKKKDAKKTGGVYFFVTWILLIFLEHSLDNCKIHHMLEKSVKFRRKSVKFLENDLEKL